MMTPHLIGIAGPSCSGKTKLARWLAARLDAPVLNLDQYYIDMAELPLEERARRNFDEPSALEHELIFEHARQLSQGQAIHAPVYDFATHARTQSDELVVPGQYVILEGLFTLHWPELCALLHRKIFMTAPDRTCLDRRLQRDVVERGRTPESVRWQFETTVKPMAHKHVLPSQVYADLVMSGTDPIDDLGARALALIQPAG